MRVVTRLGLGLCSVLFGACAASDDAAASGAGVATMLPAADRGSVAARAGAPELGSSGAPAQPVAQGGSAVTSKSTPVSSGSAAAVGGGPAAAGSGAAGMAGAAPSAAGAAAGAAGAAAGPGQAGASGMSGSVPNDAGQQGGGGRGAEPKLNPVYRIALRVHTGKSGLSADALGQTLEEVNWIWWSQAAICFEIETVDHDETMSTGFDLWYHQSRIDCSPGANGVYCGDHDIHSLDSPNLRATDDPMWSVERPPARTGGHELGHALSLDHFDGQPDSSDSLMASGRMGWKLHEAEIQAARRRAAMRSLPDDGSKHCSKVNITTP